MGERRREREKRERWPHLNYLDHLLARSFPRPRMVSHGNKAGICFCFIALIYYYFHSLQSNFPSLIYSIMPYTGYLTSKELDIKFKLSLYLFVIKIYSFFSATKMDVEEKERCYLAESLNRGKSYPGS